MIRSYLTIALRNLYRNKAYSAIHILGLTIGITSCLFLYVFISDELSFDQFNTKRDRIFRVNFSTNTVTKEPTNANGSYGVGPAMFNDFPEVQKFTRINKVAGGDDILVSYEKKRFYESNFAFADSSLFEIFTLPLASGNPELALQRPNTVVISESTARRYFDDSDPLGKMLQADITGRGTMVNFEVTGVMKDIPGNSSFHADFFASIHSRKNDLTNWFGFNSVYTFVLLHQADQADGLNVKLQDYSKKYMGDNTWYSVSISPFNSIHLHSDLRSEFEPTSSVTTVYIFSAIGVIVLVMACINFMMLATARSSKRAKEVGVRKSLGAYRKQLIYQFIGDAFVLSLVASLLSLAAAQILVAPFNSFTGKAIEITSSQAIDLAAFVLIVALVATVLAGLYPALFLSSFRPAVVLKGTGTGTASLGTFRKLLVVVQFSVSVMLIVGTLVVYKQLGKATDMMLLGHGEQVIVLPLNAELKSRFYDFKAAMKTVPGVLEASGVSRVPSKGSNSLCFKMQGQEKEYCAYTYISDPDFLRTLDVKMRAGRNFDITIPSDTAGAYILNVAATRELGFKKPEEALNLLMEFDGTVKGQIVGIVNDFPTWSLRDSIQGTILVANKPGFFGFLSIRTNATAVGELLPRLQEVWGSYSTTYPFSYFFLDDSFQKLHIKDQKMGRTLWLFASLAIFIACMGMLGLVSYTTEQRMKEIGIRKTLGASIQSVWFLLTRDFVVLIMIATCIAAPIAWKVMGSWLQGFAYPIKLEFWMFALGGGGALLLALLAVSAKVVKAARSNPVDSLRNE